MSRYKLSISAPTDDLRENLKDELSPRYRDTVRELLKKGEAVIGPDRSPTPDAVKYLSRRFPGVTFRLITAKDDLSACWIHTYRIDELETEDYMGGATEDEKAGIARVLKKEFGLEPSASEEHQNAES